MLADGHVENVVNIIDQKDISVWGVKWNLMRQIMPVIQSYNLGRSRGFFLVNANGLFSMMFKIASSFIDANTLAKLHVTSENTCDQITQMICPEQLEQKFGGSAPDRDEGQFWPPNLLSDKFGNEEAVVMDEMEINQ